MVFDFVSRLAWERLGGPPEELEEVAGDVWASLLKLLPPTRPPEKRQMMDEWIQLKKPDRPDSGYTDGFVYQRQGETPAENVSVCFYRQALSLIVSSFQVNWREETIICVMKTGKWDWLLSVNHVIEKKMSQSS